MNIEFTYDNYDDVTREYFNRVIDIYSLLRNRKITKTFQDINTGGSFIHTFTNMEKKEISMYLGLAISDCGLSDYFDEDESSKILDFLEISREEIDNIIKKDSDSYQRLYNSYFEDDVNDMCNIGSYIVNDMTPEVMYYLLLNSDSGVINACLFNIYDFPSNTARLMRLFGQKDYIEGILVNNKKINLIDDKIDDNDNTEKDNRHQPSILINGVEANDDEVNNLFKAIFGVKDEEIIPETKEVEHEFTKGELREMLKELRNKFIGQEKACSDLFLNIINNQHLAKSDIKEDGVRSLIFIDGPTGTGKTAITREITKMLDVPCISTSITNYSATGYVGGDITENLKQLVKKAGGNLEKAERGIIIFDEFDKLAYNRGEGELAMKRSVQQQLLDFMGGGKYHVGVGNNIFNSKEVEFDTSKLTFVLLGALTDVREDKMKQKRLIGFNGDINLNNNTYSITPQDLVDLGFERELIGRINTYLHTDEYDKNALYRILKESDISPIISFRKWANNEGKEVYIDNGVLETISSYAYELHMGARSLQTVVNNIRTSLLDEVILGDDNSILLTKENVEEVYDKLFERGKTEEKGKVLAKR